MLEPVLYVLGDETLQVTNTKEELGPKNVFIAPGGNCTQGDEAIVWRPFDLRHKTKQALIFVLGRCVDSNGAVCKHFEQCGAVSRPTVLLLLAGLQISNDFYINKID